MQASLKYRDVLRDIVADNSNITLMSVDIEEFSMIERVQMTKRDE